MKKIIVGITGASGAPLAIRLLVELKKAQVQVHLVISKGAEETLKYEANENIKKLCDVFYENENLGSSIASGTYEVDGMIIVPCSMKTIGSLACGISSNLLLRAADVCIKEKRKLLLVPRETPLSPIHLDNLSYLSKLQNIMILPPVLSYYMRPKSIEDMERLLVAKMLRYFDIKMEGFEGWK